MRLTKILPIAIFGLAGLVAWGSAMGMARFMETQSEIQVREALDAAELDWAEVRADGLRVILSGEAPSEVVRLRAVSAASDVVDSARVYDEMDVVRADAVAPPAFSLQILRDDEDVQLIGLVPGQESADSVIDAIGKSIGEDGLQPFIEVADYDPPQNWNEAIDFALNAVELMPRSQISVTAHEVRVTAIAESPIARSELEGELLARVPDELQLLLNISAPRPVISPFALRFVLDEDGARFDSCTADTMQRRAEIIRASRDLGVEGRVECVLALGVPSPSWSEAVTLALEALGDIGGGTVTFTDADITLVAAAGTDATAFEDRMGALEADLPDVFELQAIRPRDPDAPEDAPRFGLEKTADGQVQISGRMGDELSRDAANNVASALFGPENVNSTLRVGDNTPSGWTLSVLSGLEAMDNLHHGKLEVTETGLHLQGVTGDTEAQAKITSILAEGIGEGANFTLDVRYDEQYDPIARMMGPDECIAAIREITGDRKIGFEPGAATIDSATAAILDDIAVTLQDCHNVRLEIAGHTDSQGREEMNEALSQARAEVVLEELTARRVRTAAFVARGYGESVPIADNETAEGREANRRIEFNLIDTDGASDDDADDTDDAAEDDNEENSEEENSQ